MNTRFYDLLLAQVSSWPNTDLKRQLRPARGLGDIREAYRVYSGLLTDPNTKRMLFDSRQAVVFGDLAEPPPKKAQHILHPPFDQFYMELTEPIVFGDQEPEHQDQIRAFMFQADNMRAQVPDYETGEPIQFPLANLTVFKTTTESGTLQFSDSTFKVNLRLGMPFVSVAAATGLPDASQVPEGMKRDRYFYAGGTLNIENRYLGWWEHICIQYTQLFSWMMLYCMAKGIYIEQESLTRQQRRWLQQHPKLPQAWHLVKVEPKFESARREEGEGSHHSYRYDVIGHLRFTQHRVKQEDGTVGKKDYVEWVAPHQRGLANTLYIPKTYRVESGKAIHPRFKKYVEETKSK